MRVAGVACTPLPRTAGPIRPGWHNHGVCVCVCVCGCVCVCVAVCVWLTIVPRNVSRFAENATDQLSLSLTPAARASLPPHTQNARQNCGQHESSSTCVPVPVQHDSVEFTHRCRRTRGSNPSSPHDDDCATLGVNGVHYAAQLRKGCAQMCPAAMHTQGYDERHDCYSAFFKSALGTEDLLRGVRGETTNQLGTRVLASPISPDTLHTCAAAR